MDTLNQKLSSLPETARSKLLERLRERLAQSGSQDLIQRRSGTGPVPLSYTQERLWLVEQLTPGSSAYNIPLIFHLRGSLNVPALERAIEALIWRHESLRTTFDVVDGNPVQIIAPRSNFRLPVRDLSGLPEPALTAESERLVHEEERHSFDLRRGPLFRAILLRLATERYIFILNSHHIISDGWSTGILTHDLSALYTSFVANQPTTLPELAIQYPDFALWQREWLKGTAAEQELTYWKQHLSGNLTVIDLPTDKPRPPVFTFRGTSMKKTLATHLVQGIHGLGQHEGATPFMIFLAALNVLCYRYTEQEDILIGLSNANRNRSEIESIVGFFVNMLVMRTSLSGSPAFRTLLKQVRENVLNAFSNQNLPFVKLVETLQPPRDLSRSVLVQVVMTYNSLSKSPLTLSGVEVDLTVTQNGTSKFDISMSIHEQVDGYLVEVEYNTDLFEAETIGRFLQHYENLLEAIIANPDRSISDLPLLDATERKRMLVEWNSTYRAHSPYCIHHRFEERVEQNPDSVAVVFEGESLTYRELNQRANRLAHRLRHLGIGPDRFVGICVERSPDLLVGMLGILKAGGAYVPLDPAHPKERIAFMLADTQVPVLLTHASLIASLPEQVPEVMCLDTVWEELATESDANPERNSLPEHLAYTIYTSGSTGKPKGVLIEHRAVSNFIDSVTTIFEMGPHDRVLQFASPNFDVSVFEIFSALLSGARLVMGKRERLLSMPDLTRLMQEHQVTVTDLPPAVMALLPADAFPSLRIVFVGGEAFPGDLVNRWALPGRRFYNGYGPTESTVTMTLMECQGSRWEQTPPIGTPMPNHQCYVLDRHLNPVPIGVPGELHVSGAGLARGYLNRPELTAEKFITHRFDEGPAIRLYKTGDLVKYRSDGNIEFLGRLDRQVKIRGLRIELGEIEAVLSQHPSVKQQAVMVREDTPGDKRLVAYVVTDSTVNTGDLREFVGLHLPTYMIPSAFVIMETLPLTPSGKIDWRSLPEPDARAQSERVLVPPRTDEEAAISKIITQVLGLVQVSIHDNFFELGGNSLMATQVISAIRQTFHIEITLRALFEQPTIAGLASVVQDVILSSVSSDEFEELLRDMEDSSENTN